MDITFNIISKMSLVLLFFLVMGCTSSVEVTQTTTSTPLVVTRTPEATPTKTHPTSTYTPVIPTPTKRSLQATRTAIPTEIYPQVENIFGITIYSFDDNGGLPQIVVAGSGWTRDGFLWKAIEPTEGERNWNEDLDKGLIRIASTDVEPIMLIEGTPDWALKEGFTCGAVAEDKFQALAQFAYDAVTRYSVSPYNVRYWELWNEPDAAYTLGCWGDPSDTDYYGGYYYGQMLQAVYPRIKQADPDAQVLVGGLLLDCDPENPPEGKSCVTSRFLNGILASGAGPYFDGVSFHAYDFYRAKGKYDNANWHSSSSTTGPVSIVKAKYLEKVLTLFGYEDKYLVNTETAVFWGPNVMRPPCGAPEEDIPDIEVTKVFYVVQSYAVAIAQEWKANIWYSALGVRCSGLMNADLSPKAGFYAYQFTRQKLGEASFVRAISDYTGVMGYEYDIHARKLWVLWSMDGQAHEITLPETPVELNHVGSDGLPVMDALTRYPTLEMAPLFIEFER